jgi:nucleotide-binding universal stress UspA family protein
MKKILLAFDGSHFSEGAFEFAQQMNERQPVLVVGAFLPHLTYASFGSLAGPIPPPIYVPVVESYETDEVQESIEKFKERCKKNGIEFRIHEDFFDFGLPELKKETRFADLLILGSESFYKNMGTEKPNEYLRSALHTAECAVMIVPEKFSYPENNVLAYDGSESSVFAIKQFCYLFPELCLNKTLLVTAGYSSQDNVPDEQFIEELAARHFPDLSILRVQIDPAKYFNSWLMEKENAILISGAFGRSSVSQLFRKSFVSEVIQDHMLPVFISHR